MENGTKNARNQNEAGSTNPPLPTKVDPMRIFEAMVHRLEYAMDNHPIPRQTGEKLQERFRVLRPENFDGMLEPWKEEHWLRDMDFIFDAMECAKMEKCHLAIF